MVALVVIVVGLSALRHAFPTHLATEQQALEQVQATLLGKNQLEQLRLRGFSALATAPLATTPEPLWIANSRWLMAPFAGKLRCITRLRICWQCTCVSCGRGQRRRTRCVWPPM